ncbi:hypothetical protein DM860_005535 [Cuscuta australis]|uniref:DUF3615 domain-containing protein n=1 Tax=Cuscuta australis TaxID=267555 RepID=A0A328E3H9_9ASTE|nr:hypothetical protein DM860_005535 [Cuscuta australis]
MNCYLGVACFLWKVRVFNFVVCFRPHDLLPDDTKVLYDISGRPLKEIDYDDPDDELLADSRDYDRYANLALAYYNDKHCTDYHKVVPPDGGRRVYEVSWGDKVIVHCGFSAAQTTAAECDSSVKSFFAVLEQSKLNDDDVLVVSCCIADGLKTVGCEGCDISMCGPYDPSWYEKEVERLKAREDRFPLSKYAHYLADGVSLCEKARLRLPYPLLALDYYNKKHHTNYKLVDALPFYSLIEGSFMIHLNFIARQEGDVANKLFFAESEMNRKGVRVVTVCRILHGCKTTAGCHVCKGRWGKRVIHPTSGFRYGRYPFGYRTLRNREGPRSVCNPL